MRINTAIALTILAACAPAGAQIAPSPNGAGSVSDSRGPGSFPPYVVYRHFLSWVTQLDNAATAAGASDPYQFAQAFSRAGLEHPHLDILRAAAHRLDSDLQAHKAKAQVVITLYRKQAKAALAEGKPLPPAPPVIHQLERERSAILIHHYTNLRASLGPDISKQLDAYRPCIYWG
jgi:hypothetical protein